MNSLLTTLQIFLPYLFFGLIVTLQLAACGIVLGFIFGLILALLRVYGPALISAAISSMIDVIRGIPLLVIILLVYLTLSTITSLDAFWSAVLSITIYSSTYQSMAIAGALQSVSGAQMQAAEALGFTKLKAIWNVTLPQGLRFALPAWSNEVVITVKDTSLAYAIGVTELLRRADYLAVSTLNPLVAYCGAAVFYYITCTSLARVLRLLEHKTRIRGFGEK